MFALEVDHPDPRLGREYVKDGGDSYTNNLQEARLFIEKRDTYQLPWPADEGEGAEIQQSLISQRPKRIYVAYCDGCSSVRILTDPCQICGRRQ